MEETTRLATVVPKGELVTAELRSGVRVTAPIVLTKLLRFVPQPVERRKIPLFSTGRGSRIWERGITLRHGISSRRY
jgi:hypothetical protein